MKRGANRHNAVEEFGDFLNVNRINFTVYELTIILVRIKRDLTVLAFDADFSVFFCELFLMIY